MESERMCQTKEQIIAEDPDLQDYQKQIQILEKQIDDGENGEVRMRWIREKVEFESMIETRQNKQNIEYIIDRFARLERDRVLFPSVLRQLVKIPKVGWPVALAIVLMIWLIASMRIETMKAIIDGIGLSVSLANVRVGAVIAIAILLFSAFLAYTNYIEEELKERPH